MPDDLSHTNYSDKNVKLLGEYKVWSDSVTADFNTRREDMGPGVDIPDEKPEKPEKPENPEKPEKARKSQSGTFLENGISF